MADDANLTLEATEVTAELVPGRGTNGGYSLVIDGTTQSHVNPDDPRDLQLPYMQIVAGVIDGAFEPGAPLAALHLGAGALTLPRFVEATRPGSRQCVVELHRPLIEFVLDRLPLASPDDTEIVINDARGHIDTLVDAPSAWQVAIVDVFAADVTPASIVTAESFAILRDALADDGLVIVNTFTKLGLGPSHDVACTLREVFPHVSAIGPREVVAGSRVGNIIVVASHRPVDADALARSASSFGSTAVALTDDELTAFAALGAVRNDEQ